MSNDTTVVSPNTASLPIPPLTIPPPISSPKGGFLRSTSGFSPVPRTAVLGGTLFYRGEINKVLIVPRMRVVLFTLSTDHSSSSSVDPYPLIATVTIATIVNLSPHSFIAPSEAELMSWVDALTQAVGAALTDMKSGENYPKLYFDNWIVS